MARVFQGERTFMSPVLGPVERFIYRIIGVKPQEEMDWKTYAFVMLLFTLVGLVTLYGLQRLQGILPLNPQHLGAVAPDLSFNTTVSFNSNTNWQSYGGETTMSYLTQMIGLAVHNFLSAAIGMAVLVALIRGFARHSVETIGNAWVDMTRSILYILIPLSLILAVVLVSQGVVQTFGASQQAQLLQPVQDASGQTVSQQTIAVGPAASQIAIKQLGTNGGGFFNVNSAHPFENPTPLSNFLEMLAILLIPAVLYLRQNGQGYQAGLGIIDCHDVHFCGHALNRGLVGTKRKPPIYQTWCRPDGQRCATRRQHGRERAPFRHH